MSAITEADLQAAIERARREALEEAARVAKGVWLDLERDRVGDADTECALCELAAARIRALASQPAPQSDGWQPIETAPRDGTHFLAYEEGGDIYRMAYASDGASQVFCGQYVTQTPEPTHWRPLPAPPKET